MDATTTRLLALRFKRLRTLGTNAPFCATCGERRWWVPYELHHIAGRKFSDETIRLCKPCHDGVSIMQKLLPSLDQCADPELAKRIAQLEGLALLLNRAAEEQLSTAKILRSISATLCNDNAREVDQ